MKKSPFYRQLKPLGVLFTSITLFVACSNAPSSMIIAPEVRISQQNGYVGEQALIRVSDMRTAHHLVEVIQEDKAAQIVTSDVPLQKVTYNAYVDNLKSNGLEVVATSTNQLSLVINQAKVTVNQSLTKYSSQSQITLTAQLKVGESTLTKTFNSKASSNGLLKADIAVIERDFNQQLGNIIAQVVQDPELQAFIKNSPAK